MLPLVLAVCKSPPKTAEVPTKESDAVAVTVTADGVEPSEPEPEVTPDEDHIQVTQELYEQTLAEVKAFIENLNKIISRKDYNAWKNTLSDERFAEIASPEFLARASEQPLLKAQKVVLKKPEDYFVYVVVPSRATTNNRVDEIDFVDTHRVKAYVVKVYVLDTKVTKDKNNVTQTETKRLRLYELIKIGNEWKIIS